MSIMEKYGLSAKVIEEFSSPIKDAAYFGSIMVVILEDHTAWINYGNGFREIEDQGETK